MANVRLAVHVFGTALFAWLGRIQLLPRDTY